MGISDDFQHSRGQKDGANGKPFGDFNRKYHKGYDAGRFDYDKKKYGETIAKGAKAERDFARRISEGKKLGKSRKEPARTEEPSQEIEYCPVCGDEYDGDYCYTCEDYDDDYDEEDDDVARIEEQRESEIEIIAKNLVDKSEIDLRYIANHDDDLDMRKAAISIMDELNYSNAIDLRYIANHDNDSSIRIAAINKMNELNYSNAIDLRYIANHDNDVSIRIAAINKMNELNSSNKFDLEYMVNHDSNSEVREAACEKLGIDPKESSYKEPSTTSYKSSTLSHPRTDTKELEAPIRAPNWVSGLLALLISGTIVGGIGIKKYNEYKSKKSQPKTSISRIYDRTQDYEAINQPARISNRRQTEKQSLEERLGINLIKWCREKGYKTYLISIKDYEIVGKHSWAVGYFGRGARNVIYSSDEGKTWEVQWRGNTFFGPDPFKVKFLNENEGWVATNKSILHTINGGKTWNTISRPYARSSFGGGYIRNLQVVSDNHLRVYLDDGKPYNSFDRGRTWSSYKTIYDEKK